MNRYSDEEILGLYVPRGLSPPIREGAQFQCARLRCSRVERAPGERAHRWGPRHGQRRIIELCARCHRELSTIVFGG
jgi:hypothetical protein